MAHPIAAVKKETFSWVQLLGFILLVCGTLVYNEIVIIRYFGFDTNTKVEREKRKRQDDLMAAHGGDEDGNAYIAVSPNAHYDASKNRRKVQAKVDEINKARFEGGLNKSEITVEETSYKVYSNHTSS